MVCSYPRRCPPTGAEDTNHLILSLLCSVVFYSLKRGMLRFKGVSMMGQ